MTENEPPKDNTPYIIDSQGNKIPFQTNAEEEDRQQSGIWSMISSILLIIGLGFFWSCLVILGILFSLFAVCISVLAIGNGMRW